jgi:transposase, IS5 family
MRQLFREQLPSSGPGVEHRHAEELARIDRILWEHPDMSELVLQDLAADVSANTGRAGMQADQVLRVAIVKQLGGFSYEELSFRLPDSRTYRRFCGYGCLEPTPSRSTLQRNIKRIREETWHALNRILLGHAKQVGVENGRKVRVDATVVESNIHPPSDAAQLWDAVRVLNRLFARAHEAFGVTRVPNRKRRAKRRALEVQNARQDEERTKAYVDLLKVTKDTVKAAQTVAAALETHADPQAQGLAEEILHFVRLTLCVIDQTERRVLYGESVPAEDKIVSLFEDHTDVIVKDRRDTYFGHKLTLTGGASGLILDWVVEDGNPADSTVTVRMLERLKDIYGQVPRQAAFDGGFASTKNLKAQGT